VNSEDVVLAKKVGIHHLATVAIIIDDLGSNEESAKQLILLPAQLTYSFLPHTPFAKKLAIATHEQGKEVMLHLPMEPIGQNDMGPGGLSLGMNRTNFESTVREAVLAVPYAVGINNHMGSSLTQSMKNMHWLMQAIKSEDNFYFVDSRTHFATVAAKMASQNHLQHASRDIFLDHVVERSEIDRQFRRLIKRARRTGHALAIAHPHQLTLDALEDWLPVFEEQGIQIVPVSKYIQSLEVERNNNKLWQASLSLSPQVLKN